LSKAAFATLLAALLACGCGTKAITAGSRPFPAGQEVFSDASGRRLADLPGSGEAVRLVLLDFPWCPACREVWKTIGGASGQAPPGSLRVYRILFDREVAISAEQKRDTDPLRPAELPWAGSPSGGPAPEVVSLTALPGEFFKEFRVRQAPVLLLIDGDGTVARRWNGYSTKLAGELSSELRKRFPPP